MWKPPQRIKHAVPEARWPEREEAARALLFQPIRGRPDHARRAHLGAGDGAVAGHRRRPRHRPRCSTGTSASPRASRAPWWSRPPASATSRAGRCCASATTASCPASPDWSTPCAGRAAAAPGSSSSSSTSSPSGGGRAPRSTSTATCRSTDRHREAVGPGHSDEEVRQILLFLPEEVQESILSERELEALRYGYRERVTDIHLPARRATCRGRCRSSSPPPRRAPGRPASTASSCTTRTPTPWPPSSRRSTTAPTATAARREERVRLPLEVYAAVRARTGRGLRGGLPLPGRGVRRRRLDGRGRGLVRRERFARAGMDFLSLSRGGKFEDAKQPQIGWAAYPYTGPSGYECMPTVISDERGPFGRNLTRRRPRCAPRCARPAAPRRWWPRAASAPSSRPRTSCAGAPPTSSPRRASPSPTRTGSARCASGAAPRCGAASTPTTARGSTRCTSRSPASSGTALELDEPGVKLSRDGRRRLVAPRWRPAEDPSRPS